MSGRFGDVRGPPWADLTKCEFYYEVVAGCWNEVGPDCFGQRRVAHEASLPTIPDRIAEVQARRLAKKQARRGGDGASRGRLHRHAGQLPRAKPAHVSLAAYNRAMAHDGDFAAPGAGPEWALAAAALATVAVAAWAHRTGRLSACSCRQSGGRKHISPHSETSPLIRA